MQISLSSPSEQWKLKRQSASLIQVSSQEERKDKEPKGIVGNLVGSAESKI